MEWSLDNSKTLSNLNESLLSIGQSPVKLHSVPPKSKIAYGTRKLTKSNETCQTKMSNIRGLGDKEILCDQSIDKNEDDNKVMFFDNMTSKMKEKLNSNCTRAEKIQVLTIAPSNSSKSKMMEEFSVSYRMVKTARTLESTSGICSLPPPRKGKCLSTDAIKKVKCFHENNENTRIMPGVKDRVSVKKNQYEQKRLLLCTLKELYIEFKKQNEDIKIDFFKFCTLWPKRCISAGTSGTHSSACAQFQHQYSKGLFLQQSNFELTIQLVFETDRLLNDIQCLK